MPGDTAGRHVVDDLPSLLTGEATQDEVMSAARHLRQCPECRIELISAAVAHNNLLSARNVLRGDNDLERRGPPTLRLLLGQDVPDEEDPV